MRYFYVRATDKSQMYKTISYVRRYFATIRLQRQGSPIKFYEGPNKGQIFKKVTEPAPLAVRTYVGRKKLLIRFKKWATLDPRGPDFWPVDRSLGNPSLRYLQNT